MRPSGASPRSKADQTNRTYAEPLWKACQWSISRTKRRNPGPALQKDVRERGETTDRPEKHVHTYFDHYLLRLRQEPGGFPNNLSRDGAGNFSVRNLRPPVRNFKHGDFSYQLTNHT